jgi:hypothetical protein
MSTRTGRFRVFAAEVIALTGTSAAVAGPGGASASASPAHAKNALIGTFDCGSAEAGTFVVNNGNAHAAVTWNVAHLTFADGSRAVFQPRAFDLTFTFGGQSMTQVASKNGPGSTVCSISASQDGFSLSGTVTGKVTVTG